METRKKAGYCTDTTIARHKSGEITPIPPDNRRPRGIITHLLVFCKGFSADRFFRDGFFPPEALLCGFRCGFFHVFPEKSFFSNMDAMSFPTHRAERDKAGELTAVCSNVHTHYIVSARNNGQAALIGRRLHRNIT